MATKDTLTEIRKNIENCIGQKVTLRTNKGKRKSKVNEGILSEVYNSVFVVNIDGGFGVRRKVSYSYSDVLTDTVEITLIETQNNIKVV